ncbi:MAG: hypothetical protein HC774_00355 [Sphingomonadales bacterium]|nr:hypothetical protein [Sphingomonadales bacterium]
MGRQRVMDMRDHHASCDRLDRLIPAETPGFPSRQQRATHPHMITSDTSPPYDRVTPLSSKLPAKLVPFADAIAHCLHACRPLASEEVALSAAVGRRLSAPAIARWSNPPSDMAAMDGFAVRHADCQPGRRLTIVGESAPGRPWATDCQTAVPSRYRPAR